MSTKSSVFRLQCQKVSAKNLAKSHLFKWLFKKNGILAVSSSDLGLELTTLNKLSKEEQLLGLFQFNLLFALYQSSSSNSYCKLKLTKVPLDLCLDKARFLVIAHGKQPTLCSWHSWKGKGRPENLRPLVSLSTFGLLWWPPQGHWPTLAK